MKQKRKKIPKEEAYELFVAALKMAEIPCFDQIDENGNKLLKPKEKWQDELTKKMVDIFPEVSSFSNYPGYLKDRFNSIKRILYDPSQKSFSYQIDQFSPLIHYATEQLEHAVSRVFSNTVLLAPNRYSPFNIWRLPDHGKLIRFENSIRFEGKKKTITFPIPEAIDIIKMPPFKGEWVKISNKPHTIYLAVSDELGALDDIVRLESFLS